VAGPALSRPAKLFAAWLVRWSGLAWLIRETVARRKVSIFLYHHPDPADFRRQLRYLSRRYAFISLDRLVDAIERQDWSSIPPKSLVVTFDDGHRATFELGAVCREFGVVPTMYVCGGLIGTNRHFWWEEAGEDRESLKRLPSPAFQARLSERWRFTFTREYESRQALSLAELERMRPYLSVQSHTRFHRILPQCTDAERADEIVGSKREIEELTGQPCEHLSFPNGDCEDVDVHLAKLAGYRSARTTKPGWNDLRTDPFRLRIAGAPERGSANAAAASIVFLFLRSLFRPGPRRTPRERGRVQVGRESSSPTSRAAVRWPPAAPSPGTPTQSQE
jgi:peptidoglycan/xylan/chitin deacetylase (PgdA/CDA1 family)